MRRPRHADTHYVMIYDVEYSSCGFSQVKPKRTDVTTQPTASQQRAVEEKERLAALRAERESAAAARDEEKRKREEAKKIAAARMAERLSAKGTKGKSHGKHSKK